MLRECKQVLRKINIIIEKFHLILIWDYFLYDSSHRINQRIDHDRSYKIKKAMDTR